MTTQTIHRPLIIVGSGPAGYTAAIYAARANLAPVMITGLEMGGQLMTTTEVENFPGFPEGIQGPQLMELMRKQAERFGTEMVYATITETHLTEAPKRLVADNGTVYTCDALVVATGASAKYLGLPSEKLYKNRGVSGCATCDGFFFKGQDIAVLGGGDTAMEEALYLANICGSVTVVHRRDQLRASKIMAERAQKHPKIRFEWNSEVLEVVGDGDKVTGLKLKNNVTNEEKELTVSGVFVAIGHKPNTDPFPEVTRDEQGYFVAEKGSTRTNVPGVFVAGDCGDRVYRQAVTSAGTGCMAAMDAERYLGELEA